MRDFYFFLFLQFYLCLDFVLLSVYANPLLFFVIVPCAILCEFI
jgi:hypothetical protein